MTSPGPAPTVTPTPAFGDPGTHHLVCGTNPLLILWFNWREKNPPEPRPRVWGALWAPEPEPGGGGPPNFYGLLQITSWKWPSAAGSPGSLRGAVFHAREKSRTWPCAARPTWPEAPGSRGAVASPGRERPLVRHRQSPRALWASVLLFRTLEPSCGLRDGDSPPRLTGVTKSARWTVLLTHSTSTLQFAVSQRA